MFFLQYLDTVRELNSYCGHQQMSYHYPYFSNMIISSIINICARQIATEKKADKEKDSVVLIYVLFIHISMYESG